MKIALAADHGGLENGDAERGIIACGTGIGISIAANKAKGVRCALCINRCAVCFYSVRGGGCRSGAGAMPSSLRYFVTVRREIRRPIF